MSETAFLSVNNVSVAYHHNLIVDAITFNLHEGDIGCMLGPSGCGKTTLLRTIAGFETPNAGNICIHGQQISNAHEVVPPERRNIGMVFQDFALFPHLSIADNIAFGLRKQSKESKRQRVAELLDLISLSGQGEKYPHQLSGGQQQRVALARAMAPRPDLLLLDEPFSSLDVELRKQLAKDVREILKKEGITAILVTHDQDEAFAMADMVGLINKGMLVQWDTPYNLYHRPATRDVADFIGEGEIMTGRVVDEDTLDTPLGIIRGKVPVGCKHNCPVDVLVRPDDIIHDDDSDICLEIIDKEFRGADFLYTLKVDNDTNVLCIAPSHHDHALHSKLGVQLDIEHIVVFKHNPEPELE